MTPARTLLITTLAEYQTEFWLAAALTLRSSGNDVAFISFDDRSTERLRAAGFETWSVGDPTVTVHTDLARACAEHEIDNSNFWLSHERYTFAIRDSELLQRKLLRYLALAGDALDALRGRGRAVTMVQELGGFVSVVASYFAARRRGVDNWFIEPSFFRGRLFFLRNSFRAARIDPQPAATVSPEVRAYLDATLNTQAIVIPQKDRHQYTTAARKIVNRRNVKRLVQKSIDKYLLGKHQEFGHITHHVRTHARMLLNNLRLRRWYTPLPQAGRFVYYPLHVPADMALTLRSPEYLDQLALIEWLLRSVPQTHAVAIKEHPAMIGAIDAHRVTQLMDRFDNLLMLPPSTNNFDVLRACDGVVSINSKAGAEATLVGKPVLVLGDAFYRSSPAVRPIEHVRELPTALAETVASPQRVQPEQVAAWFQNVWDASSPGELYVADEANVETFCASLTQRIGSAA